MLFNGIVGWRIGLHCANVIRLWSCYAKRLSEKIQFCTQVAVSRQSRLGQFGVGWRDCAEWLGVGFVTLVLRVPLKVLHGNGVSHTVF